MNQSHPVSFSELTSSSIAWNNRGVADMIAGNTKGAAQKLAMSLGQIKEALVLVNKNEDPSSPSSSTEDSETDKCQERSIHTRSVDISLPPHVSSFSSGFTQVHSQAAILEQVSTSPFSSNTCNTVSAVVVFNLALLHHIRGLCDSSSGSSEKAQRLYEHSYQLHLNDATASLCSANSSDCYRCMLILNNLAHIHASLGSMERAKQCLQRLLTLFWYLREYGLVEAPSASTTDLVDVVSSPEDEDCFMEDSSPSSTVPAPSASMQAEDKHLSSQFCFISNVLAHFILKDAQTAPAA